jgi:hypothetical protein
MTYGLMTKFEVKNIKVDEISRPECLTNINNSFVYVGSKLGDFQLIRLTKELHEIKSSRYTQTICENAAVPQ